MEPLTFAKSDPFTLGVELQFQLLHPTTLDLAPRSTAFLNKVPDAFRGRIRAEFLRSAIEVNTGICADMNELEHEMGTLCRTFETLARAVDCLGLATSLHPFAQAKDRHLSPGEPHQQTLDDLQMASRSLITQAMHVHIGMPDATTAVRLCDAIRPYLPLLLALTTSSPYFEGEDSGFSSYRTNLCQALPRSGVPETLGTWQRFRDLVTVLNETTPLSGIKELWWDVRPHPQFGTLEIRICDMPSRFEDILAVVALCQLLAVSLAGTEGEPPAVPHREIMLSNKWNASRYGLAGTYIAPQAGGRHIPFGQAATELLEALRPEATELATTRYLAPVKRILQQGTSAQRQRAIYRKTGDFRVVIEELRREFWA